MYFTNFTFPNKEYEQIHVLGDKDFREICCATDQPGADRGKSEFGAAVVMNQVPFITQD